MQSRDQSSEIKTALVNSRIMRNVYGRTQKREIRQINTCVRGNRSRQSSVHLWTLEKRMVEYEHRLVYTNTNFEMQFFEPPWPRVMIELRKLVYFSKTKN